MLNTLTLLFFCVHNKIFYFYYIKLIYYINHPEINYKLNVALDTQEAPRSLSLGSSSSVESLASDGDLEQHSDGEPPQRQHRR